MKEINVQFTSCGCDNFAMHRQIESLLRENAALRFINKDHEMISELLELEFDRVVMVCANAYSITVDDLWSKARRVPLPWARQLAAVCFTEMFRLPLTEAVKFFPFYKPNGLEYAIQSVKNRMSWPHECGRIASVRKFLGLPV